MPIKAIRDGPVSEAPEDTNKTRVNTTLNRPTGNSPGDIAVSLPGTMLNQDEPCFAYGLRLESSYLFPSFLQLKRHRYPVVAQITFKALQSAHMLPVRKVLCLLLNVPVRLGGFIVISKAPRKTCLKRSLLENPHILP